MSDINDRVMQAVREVMLAHPHMDTSRALRFALDDDPQLASDYHHAGDDCIDPGHNHPQPERPGTVRDVPLLHAGPRRHYSELDATEKARELRKLGVNAAVVHRMGSEAAGGGFVVAVGP